MASEVPRHARVRPETIDKNLLRRRWAGLARLALSVLILALLAFWLDAEAIVRQLAGTDPLLGVIALALVQVQIAGSALRWRLAAAMRDTEIPLGRAVREYYVASLLNVVLPGGVAGDVTRAVRARDGGKWRDAALPVVIERGMGQIAMAFLLFVGGALASRTIGTPTGLSVGAAVLAVALLALLEWSFRRPALRGHAVLLRRQFVLSLVVAVAYLAMFACCAAAIGAPLSLGLTLTLVPPVLLSMVLPLTIGGWGLREGAAALLWPMAGLSAEAGIATGLIYGLACILGALPGVAWLWRAR